MTIHVNLKFIKNMNIKMTNIFNKSLEIINNPCENIFAILSISDTDLVTN